VTTDESDAGGFLPLVLLAIVVGAFTGFVAGSFRLLLERADRLRLDFVTWAQGFGVLGLLLTILCAAAATGLAAYLVRRYSPLARGSGIPEVEATLKGEVPPWGRLLLVVKYIGGLLAIGAGLALGREGPSIQMGANVGHFFGSIARTAGEFRKTLIAAGAGSGLAVTFNAPISGAAFVIEELVKRFETRITIATLGASATAVAVARLMIGDAPDFPVPPVQFMAFRDLPLYLVLGVVCGVLGGWYARAILGALALADRFDSIRVEWRAAVVGAVVGLIAWYAPGLVGGGDNLTRAALDGTMLGSALLFVFALRFVLGPASYAAGTPGGIFAPMLVLGAQLGVMLHWAADALGIPSSAQPLALAIVGMSAFFTAVVRAPLTGIVLVAELTASVSVLLPMLAASFTAMAVAEAMKVAPVYDSLGARAARKQGQSK
jgi:CIC family chloride channel protein